MNILIFEDNKVNQIVIKNMLKNLGYEDITIKENGQEGIKEFENNPKKYDLIFLDIKMPIIDGYEVITYLKKKYKPGELPYIIGLTANAMNNEEEKCLSLGMDAYMSKPIKMSIIKEKIEKMKMVRKK
jgi:CheY-like chemotaxis protein